METRVGNKLGFILITLAISKTQIYRSRVTNELLGL